MRRFLMGPSYPPVLRLDRWRRTAMLKAAIRVAEEFANEIHEGEVCRLVVGGAAGPRIRITWAKEPERNDGDPPSQLCCFEYIDAHPIASQFGRKAGDRDVGCLYVEYVSDEGKEVKRV